MIYVLIVVTIAALAVILDSISTDGRYVLTQEELDAIWQADDEADAKMYARFIADGGGAQ